MKLEKCLKCGCKLYRLDGYSRNGYDEIKAVCIRCGTPYPDRTAELEKEVERLNNFAFQKNPDNIGVQETIDKQLSDILKLKSELETLRKEKEEIKKEWESYNKIYLQVNKIKKALFDLVIELAVKNEKV